MSFAEVISEIPRFSAEERRELIRRVLTAEHAESGGARDGYTTQNIDGQIFLVAPRVIHQSEVDAILDEFP